MTKKIFQKNVIFFYSVRFINIWVEKNSHFTSNVKIGNPLGAFKDIKISAKSIGRTCHIKFSDPINSA